jgi:hypothetical protein
MAAGGAAEPAIAFSVTSAKDEAVDSRPAAMSASIFLLIIGVFPVRYKTLEDPASAKVRAR